MEIPGVVGGHTVRDPPQLDAGVSLNMYPERSKRETQYEGRVSRFQLSVHGYERFTPDNALVPVTALRGTREPEERLAVANGRTLRIFRNPGAARSIDRVSVSGQPVVDEVQGAPPMRENRLRPPFGCMHFPRDVAGEDYGAWYWVRDDGQIYWNAHQGTQANPNPQKPNNPMGEPVRIRNPGGIRPLGLTGILDGDDVFRVFISSMNDRIIRCWTKVRTQGDPPRPQDPNVRIWERDRASDLNLADDTAIGAPGSIWMSGTTLLVLDEITGRIVEFIYNQPTGRPGRDHEYWRRQTPIGGANPMSLQRMVGDPKRLEPVTFGGLYQGGDAIWAANRANGELVRVKQRTGVFQSSTPMRQTAPTVVDFRDGEATAKYACGAVAGSPGWWYISGTQYADDFGRVFRFDPIADEMSKITTPPLPDVEQADPPIGDLVTLGDEGRHMAWVVDRRLHIIDLVEDRVILNVEGNVDSVDYSVPRLIAADASTGVLKVSPVNGISIQTAEPYGEILPAARLRVPGVSADFESNNVTPNYNRPERVRSMFVGLREVITVLENGRAVRYKRNQMREADNAANRPVALNIDEIPGRMGRGNVWGVAAAAAQTAFFLRDRTRTSITRIPQQHTQTTTVPSRPDASDLEIRLYSDPPKDQSEFNDTGNFTRKYMRVGNNGVADVYAWAANAGAGLVFACEVPDQGQQRRCIDVYQDGDVLSAPSLRAGSSRDEDQRWVSRQIGQRIQLVNKPGSTTVFIPNIELGSTPSTAQRAAVAEGLLFEDLEFDAPLPRDWLRGVTFVPDANAASGGFLYVAIQQREGIPNRTVVRAFELREDGWVRAAARDIDVGLTTNNRTLSHDGQFLFDTSALLVSDQLDDGTTVRSTTIIPFRHGLTANISQYAWNPEQRNTSGAAAVATVRKNLYVFSPTGMELRDLTDATEGFPYRLTETRTIGLVAPRSLALVADILYWLGVTDGGGLRIWRVGHMGDGVPELVEGKSIEQMLDTIAAGGSYATALENAVGWSDDTGGHPTYVLHMAEAGVSLCYDADADRWHVRSSVEATGDDHLTWPWMPPGEGVQRVRHSTTWQGRLICGGYDRARNGALAFHAPRGWTDIDGGDIYRRRQFSAGAIERERIRFQKLRVDAVYDVEVSGQSLAGLQPKFSVHVSDDGGKTFDRDLGQREFGALAQGRPPRPFFRIGYSRERVYRVDCSAPVDFALRGASQIAGPGGAIA